ncbi:hypothetical protein OV450_8224 [Actinobacteria bacterium OV450]|nr:hypothetical protein OV450_8224 [Actinobacteria bacterium OV450]
MSERRASNERLRHLLREAGWTGEAFARAVNATAAEAGLSLRYQRPSVAQWLAGAVPRAPVPELIAEALSRRLGRVVSVADAGFGRLAKGGREGSEPLETGVSLRMPARAGGVPADILYHLAALDEVLDEARTGIVWSGLRPTGGRIGKEEAAAAQTALLMFSSVDKSFGGGYIRAALAAYLTTVIDPWLKAPSSPATARDLRRTAAQLTYLCAFVHFDDMKHGLAQWYYLRALDLTDSADDELTTAVILRGLSVQAYTLGHYPQARRLAQAAHDRCPPWAPGYLRAALLGQRAVTASAFKETRSALEDLASAERHLHGAEEPTAPVGAYHRASLAHQRAETAVHLNDFKHARTAFADALRLRPSSEQRAHALILHKLATLELSRGQLEVACHQWQQLIHDYTALNSCRADGAISEMRSLLRPFSRNPMAASLLRTAAQSSRYAR